MEALSDQERRIIEILRRLPPELLADYPPLTLKPRLVRKIRKASRPLAQQMLIEVLRRLIELSASDGGEDASNEKSR